MQPVYKPRSWHLLAVALIALFDLVVLYMVLRPNVADDYRAYYIDRTASCYPRADNVASGYYPLGAPISFVPDRSGYKLDTVRWCGFQPPSNTGIRSFGDYGIIRMKLPLPDDDLLLTFSSWANTDSSKPERDVQVSVNGERVGTLPFKSAKRMDGKIIIPQRVAKAGGKDDAGNDLLLIRFDVPRTGPPGTNSEPITLQLRLEAMRVTALGNTTVVKAPGAPETEKAGPGPASSRHPGRLG